MLLQKSHSIIGVSVADRLRKKGRGEKGERTRLTCRVSWKVGDGNVTERVDDRGGGGVRREEGERGRERTIKESEPRWLRV